MKTHISSLVALVLFGLTLEAASAESSLEIDDLWIAEAPPVSKVLAGYMQIKNTGDTDKKLISASSVDFSSIEFHRSIEKDGMASMQRQEFLLVPAGSSLILEPGDYHLMLFNPTKKLRAGANSVIQFKLDNGNVITGTATVKKSTVDHSHHNHH